MKKAKAVFKSGRFLRTAAVLARGTLAELARGLKAGELGLTDNGVLVTKQAGKVVPVRHEGSRVSVDMTGSGASALVNVTEDMDGKVVVLEHLPASVTSLTIKVAANVAVVDVTLPTGTRLAALGVVDGEGRVLATEKGGAEIPASFVGGDRFQLGVMNGVLRVGISVALPPYTLRFKANKAVTTADFWALPIALTLVDDTTHTYDVTLEQADWSFLFRPVSGENTWLEAVVGANTIGVTRMERMFQQCTSLTSVSLFDTSSVTDMNSMFYGCTSLTSVPLFDTSSVTNISYMFYGCTSLTSVPLFDTSSVKNMNSIFNGCTSLTSVPLFDTSSVTDIGYMLQSCSSLTSVPLFDTSSVTNMGGMLRDCRKVERGALALYTKANTQVNPPSSHSNAFKNCGADTETGLAELQQIPTSWGGLAS